MLAYETNQILKQHVKSIICTFLLFSKKKTAREQKPEQELNPPAHFPIWSSATETASLFTPVGFELIG